MFDWIKYVEFAEHLNDTMPTEESFRSSISRSYYGSYGRLRNFCVNKIKILTVNEAKGSSCHKLMYDRMIEADDIDLLTMAQQFYALKLRRQTADYDASPDRPITRNMAADTSEKSRTLIAAISDYQV